MDETIGQVLRTARFRSGKSLSEMGRLVHASKSALCNYETGERPIPDAVILAYWHVTGDKEIPKVAVASALMELWEFYAAFQTPPNAPAAVGLLRSGTPLTVRATPLRRAA